MEEIDEKRQSMQQNDPPCFLRHCIECGKMHDTGSQNMETGEMMERFEECKDCYIRKRIRSVPVTGQVVLEEDVYFGHSNEMD